MAIIKVHELAKELGVERKTLISYLKEKGYTSITAVSSAPEKELDNIRARFGGGNAAPQEEPKKVEETDANVKPLAPETEAPRKKGGFRKFRKPNATEASSEQTEATTTEAANAPAAVQEPASSAPEEKPAAPSVEGKAPTEMSAEPANPAPVQTDAKQEAPVKAPEKTGKPDKSEKTEKNGKPAGKKSDAPKEKDSSRERKNDGEQKSAGSHGKGDQKSSAQKSQGEQQKSNAADAKSEAKPAAPATPPRPQIGVPIRRYDTLSSDAYVQAAAQRNAAARGGNVDRGQRTGGRSGQANGGGRGSFGQGQQRSGRPGDRGGSFGQRGGQGGQGGQRGSYGQGGQGGQGGRGGQGRTGFNQGQGSSQGRQGFSGGNGPARGGRPMGGGRPGDGDGALAHKTSRDYQGGKNYDKNREERRENGRRGDLENRQGQGHRQFNFVPKALQQKGHSQGSAAEKEVVTEIRLPERITVRDLAEKMKIPAPQIVKELFMKGLMVTVNHEIPFEQAQEIALAHDIIAEPEEKEDVIGALLAEDEEDEKDMVPRPPVVCVMGHVDHGKTSLLDAIRNTHVTDKEAGGITQHIGAYMVSINGQKITFLDTPGHEAFTAMRMRGANSTDIAVLVVAADDGVMPQTVEAINHAKAANVTVIVAVNKIDKPGANVDRVYQELSEYGLLAEEWGGDTVFCKVSAKTHEGIDNLLEMILLSAEMAELKANPNRNARGLVLEAKLDKGRGPVATILVQKGTLKQGDYIACGSAYGRVRAMNDEKGKRLSKATPSMPAEVIGLSAVPHAGEVLMAFDSDKESKAFAAAFVSEEKKNKIEETKTQMSLEQLYEQIKEGNLKELPIVVKADVQGSVEALRQNLTKLSNDEVVVKVIHGGVGAISESDIALAAASNAIVIGFNVRPDTTAKAMAEAQKVDVHTYSVIYEAIGDVERALKGMRAAVYEEKILGHAEIRMIFRSSSTGNIAGSYVKDGVIQRGCKVRVFRGEEKLYEGQLASLKRFKDDVKEVREGFECGLVFDGFGDFEVEDRVEAYTMVQVEQD